MARDEDRVRAWARYAELSQFRLFRRMRRRRADRRQDQPPPPDRPGPEGST